MAHIIPCNRGIVEALRGLRHIKLVKRLLRNANQII